MRHTLKFLAVPLFCLFSVLAHGYDHRATITWNTPPASTLTDYPALVYISDPTLKSTINTGYVLSSNDIVAFSDSLCTTPLNFQMAGWNGVTGEAVLWVDLPTFASSSPAPIYICYGSGSATDLSAKQTVWANANYAEVYHFGYPTLVGDTSTADTTYGVLSNVQGICDTSVVPLLCADTLTTSQYTSGGVLGSALPQSGAIRTAEVWFRLNSNIALNTTTMIAGYGTAMGADEDWAISYYNNTNGACGHAQLQIWDSSVVTCFSWTYDSNWHFVTWGTPSAGATSNSWTSYYDGSFQTLLGGGTTNSPNTVSGFNELNGAGSGSYTNSETVAEYRVSTVAESAAWLGAVYNNIKNIGTYETATIASGSWGTVVGSGTTTATITGSVIIDPTSASSGGGGGGGGGGGSSGIPTPPANATTFNNVQNGCPGGSYVICNKNSACAAGTPRGSGTASISYGDMTHHLSTGGALLFTNTTNSGSATGWNTLIYCHNGTSWPADDASGTNHLTSLTNAIYDFWIYLSPSPAGVVGYEWDPDFFVGTANWTYKISLACYTDAGGIWDLYNQSIQNWQRTTTACTMNAGGANAWHHLQYWITLDQVHHRYTYQELDLDGTPVFTPSSPPSIGNTFGGWNVNKGNQFNFEFQIDNKSGAGTSKEWIDNAKVIVW